MVGRWYGDGKVKIHLGQEIEEGEKFESRPGR